VENVSNENQTVASVTHRLITETQLPASRAEYPSVILGVPSGAPIESQIRQQAFDWYAALHSPERVSELWPLFEQWLAERPEHRSAYLWVERISAEASELAADGDDELEGDRVRLPGIRFDFTLPRVRSSGWWKPLVVCSVILVIGIPLLAPGQTDAVFETERGKQRTIVLADKSTVTLNTNTRLHVRLSFMRRDLQLLRGQALFQVYREWVRPFCVRANDTAVSATGTQFAMHLKQDGTVETAVAEGEVTVDTRHAGSQQATEGGGESRAVAQAGDTVTVTPDGRAELAHAGKSDVERELKWREGKIAFEQGSLAEWVEEFNRYNKRTFQIDDDRIAQQRISGEFNAKDPDSFASALQDTYGIRVISSDADDVIHLRPAK
jgi:transmembrane sensor